MLLFLGSFCLLGFLTQLVEDDMPRVVNDADVAKDDSQTFSEEAAWRYLDIIVGDAPRVAGTRYHLNKTQDLKAMVDSIAFDANREVRTDWQVVTGDFFLRRDSTFVSYYQNVSNVIALLVGESGFHANGTLGSSILLNCHYDSVPYAIGASDNALFCAVMAETLSKLSRRRDMLKHNIVFLFNGAEENPLQGSHGFLQHPWAKGVTVVVNMDSAGINGKSTIFQVTDPRLLYAYQSVVSAPNAQGIGEFLFSSGIIPSDTDFRVFRDFGDIHGIDIAFAKGGHVYHTRYDRPSLIREGVIQCAGEMLLGLTSRLGDMEELAEKISPTAAVYYDYLNVLLVVYSLPASYVVDFCIALLGTGSVVYYVWLVGPRWHSVKDLLFAAGGRVACTVAGIVVTAILVPIQVATTVQMRYLTQPWLVVPLYWMPYLITAVVVSHLYDRWRCQKNGMSRSIRVLQGLAATRLLMTAILLVLLCIPSLVSTRYLVSAPLSIMSLMSIVSMTLVRYIKLRGWQHLVLEACLAVPSAMYAFSLALRLDAMMLPIMARSASYWPDYTVAIINVGLVVVASTTLSGIELLFSRRRLWIPLVPLGVTCVVLMFIPFSPYQDEGPSTQRHYWFHSQLITKDFNNETVSSTSGLMVSMWDPYTTEWAVSALMEKGLNYNVRRDFAEDCDRYVYCNLPMYRTSMGQHLSKAIFLYTGPPAEFDPPASVQVVSKSCVGQTCTYSFSMIGAPHNTLTFWPRDNVTLTGWSLSSPLQTTFTLLERPVFVVTHSTATYSEVVPSLQFTLTMTIPVILQSGPVLDISFHAFKIHHPEEYTAEYSRIMEAVPLFFNIASFLTFRYNYVF